MSCLFSGKTWFTDEVLLAQARHMWKSMSKEARVEYGEDYFEQSVRSLETYTKGEVCLCTWHPRITITLLMSTLFWLNME
jgi:hypothetical protein